MNNPLRLLLVLFAAVGPMTADAIAQSGDSGDENPQHRLFESVAEREAVMWANALQIWEWAEPGYQELRSAARLADWLEQSGFNVTRGVAGIPTAFVAEFGSGKPVIGILGEYDALPGISQAATPIQQSRPGVTYGHACGHHLFGVASAAAAMAIAEQIEAGKVSGTIRFYGCPAEEGGSAKVFLVRQGLFDDCDAVLHWHPSSRNAAGDRGTLARIAVKFRFHGISAHAASAPEQGRSALDAVELTNHAVQLLREHVESSTRIHHVITSGGSAPNVVPNFAEVYYYVRHPDSDALRPIYERVVQCARAGALATGTELEIKFEGGIMEILPNSTLGTVTQENLERLNDLEFPAAELPFVTRIHQSLADPSPLEEVRLVINQSGAAGRGSTDVGDVSWTVPTTGFTTACWVPGTPGHSWQAVACGSQPMARRGMNLAARVLAATAWDLMTSPQILADAKAELEQRLGRRQYHSLMPADLDPPLDYRNPPIR